MSRNTHIRTRKVAAGYGSIELLRLSPGRDVNPEALPVGRIRSTGWIYNRHVRYFFALHIRGNRHRARHIVVHQCPPILESLHSYA